MRFNPPPNWPVPKSDWTPPKGWLPDPQWPPAPPGWAYWVDDAPEKPSQLPRPAGPMPPPASRPPEVAPVADTRVIAAAGSLLPVLNPARAGYTLIAAMGLALFVWMFIKIRFDGQWVYDGWMWRGLAPVVVMVTGFALITFGVAGARRWSGTRWLSVRGRRQPPTAHVA